MTKNSSLQASVSKTSMSQASMSQIPTYIVDSFTDQKFKGNPAGVCLADKPLTDRQMLNIANELGFSETAFVVFDESLEYQYIRFFSPLQEIDLCGHATLATAKILFHLGKLQDVVKFRNLNGVELVVKKDNNSSRLLMEFPAYFVEPAEVSSAMLQALGIMTDDIVNIGYNKDIRSYLIQIASCEALVNLTPDFEQLLASASGIDGVVVTAYSDKEKYDFESRYFWPWAGTNEDPVTGATHTFLSTYWGERLDKTQMTALQCSHRSGFMQTEVTEKGTVILKGEAQIILEGMLNL